MPTYRVTDPTTGRKVKLTGDTPPTEQDLTEIFSKLGTTNTEPTPEQAAPSIKDTLAQTLGPREEAPLQPPTTGGAGFMKGLLGDAQRGATLGEWWNDPKQAADTTFSAEGAGALTRDAAFMGLGMAGPKRIGGAMESTGKGMQSVGEATDAGGLSGLAMRSVVGHQIAGPVGGVAAAVAPPMLRGFGRVLQRTGKALGSSPEPVGPSPMPTPEVTPQAQPAPSKPVSVSSVPIAKLEAAPKEMAMPTVEASQQSAMLEALEGPAPLGSTPIRVKSWKPGFGPTAKEAQAYRDNFGSKTAGQLLKQRQDQIKAITESRGELPTQVVNRITSDFGTIPEVERQGYIEQANNPLVQQLLDSLKVRSQQQPSPK